MSRQLICTLCPRGCHLEVDDDFKVTGNFCPRGVNYAKTELTNPVRVLTSTVKIKSKNAIRLSVKSEKPLPKGKIFACMHELDKVMAEAPICIGDVVLTNICDTGINIVATKDIEE